MGMSPLDDFHVGERPPEDVFADRLKTVGDIRDEKAIVGRRPPGISQAGFRKEIRRDCGHRLGGIDEPDLRPRRFLEERFEQGIMGAAQDERIDPLRENGLQVLSGGQPGDRVIEPPLFDERDEERAGLGEDPDLVVIVWIARA